MATKPRNDPKQEQDEGAPDEPAPRTARFSWATIIIVAAVVLMETCTVLIVMWLSSGPSEVAAASGVKADGSVVQGDEIEELIVEGKAINTKRGVTYVYRFKIHATVAKGDLPAVHEVLERRRATIEDAVRQVIARLEPRDLDEEPELTALRRALSHEFEQLFGPERIKKLLVPEWTRMRADY